MTAALIRHVAGSGKAYSAVGDKYVILATGEQSGGTYCLLEVVVTPGGGPPPHYHTREEESFYVLEGEMTFMANGETIVGKPGTFIQIPRNMPHTFSNKSDQPAR